MRNVFADFEHDLNVAAAEIRAIGRRGRAAHVWANHATPARVASLMVFETRPESGPANRGEWIRPNTNGASAHTGWGSVPFDRVRHILGEATRHVPLRAPEKVR